MAFDEYGNWTDDIPGAAPAPVDDGTGVMGPMAVPPSAPAEPLPVPRGAAAFEDSLPGLTPPEAPELPGAPTQMREGSKFSLGTTGITDRGIRQTQKLGGFKGVDAWAEQSTAPQRDLAERTAAELQASADSKRSAIAEYGNAEYEYHQGLGKLRERIADFEDTTARLEEMAMHESKIEREQYLSAYRQQLAGVKQLMAMDANPLHNLSTGGILGLGAAAFAQGFLGAQGINVNVTGQIDAWVNRELQQHQQKIQNAKSMADEQLNLYSIARQTSQDDAEAREKLRGFIIEGFKQKVLMEGDRFNSEAARARAREKAAELDAALATTLDRLGNNYYETRRKARSERVKELADQGRLAIDGARLSLERSREDRIRAAEAKKARDEMMGNIIYDTSEGGKGMARFMFKPGIDDKEKQAYRAAQSGTNLSQRRIAELRGMLTEAGNRGITDIGRLTSTEQAKIKALRNALLSDYILAQSGKAASEKEVERLATTLPDNGALTQANLNAVYALTSKAWTDKLDTMRYELADEIPEGHELRNLRTDNTSHYNEDGYKEYRAGSAGERAPGVVDKATQGLVAPDRRKAASDEYMKDAGAENAQSEWSYFVGKNEQYNKRTSAAERTGAENFLNFGGDSVFRTVQEIVSDTKGKVPVFAAGVVGIANAAKRGDPMARAKLQDLAYGGLTHKEMEDPMHLATRDFAQHMGRQLALDLDESAGGPTTRLPEIGTDNVIPVPRPGRFDRGYQPPTVEWRSPFGDK